jgi:hypothetical protein
MNLLAVQSPCPHNRVGRARSELGHQDDHVTGTGDGVTWEVATLHAGLSDCSQGG